MSEKILVTGGGGFVGGNLARFLGGRGHEVLAPRRTELDLLDADAVRTYLVDHEITTVLHTAGRVGGIAANMVAPAAFFLDNVLIGINVVRGADGVGVRRLLNLSSSCVYPKGRELLAEEDLLTGALEPTNEGYALAKLGVSELCRWIVARDPSRAYRTIIPCNLYGPGDKFHGDGAHVLPSIIAKTVDAREAGASEVVIWGDGEARREFMHVDDLCDCIASLLPQLETMPQYLNVGPGVDRSINDYYATAARVIGWTGEFVHDLSKPVGMRRKLMDVGRLRALGWGPHVALEDGIRTTAEWYAEHHRRPVTAGVE